MPKFLITKQFLPRDARSAKRGIALVCCPSVARRPSRDSIGRRPENNAHELKHRRNPLYDLVYSVYLAANVNNNCFKVLCTVNILVFPRY